MKISFTLLCFLILLGRTYAGARNSADYMITAESTDAGGGRALSADYGNDGSHTAFVGLSGFDQTSVRHGYIGQLYDLTSLTVSADQNAREAEAIGQLSGSFLADDHSSISVSGSEIAWTVVAGPVASISAAGVMTGGLVYQNTTAAIRGNARGFTADLALTVLDTVADNFGTYAADGLPDDWQYQYFGADNPLAAPESDATGTGQTNRFKYVAGLNPIDRSAPNAVFTLEITSVPGQPGHKVLTFAPRFPDRSYTITARPSLVAGEWLPLSDFVIEDHETTRSIIDRSAIGDVRFYRVEISKP
jgi:hypothetical protein